MATETAERREDDHYGAEDKPRDRKDRSRRSRSRDKERRRRSKSRSRDRDRGDRERGDRERGDGDRERRRSSKRSSRSRSTSRDRSRRSSRKHSRSRSHSRSRDDRRSRPRKRNFDVRPPGVTDETAPAYIAQAILQQNPHSALLMGATVANQSLPVPPPAPAGMQQTRHARRIYVGGLGEVTEEELQEFFNKTIDRALDTQSPGDHVISVYINRERHFAFLELKSIELTTACMQLDGIIYQGQGLKIRRPNDYNPALVPPGINPPQFNLAALGIVGTTVADGPNKIFVGGIPYHLGEDQVKELLQSFGQLRSFHLVKDPGSTASKGYGFCEYLDPAVTDKACEGLNGLQLGEKTLTVRRAMGSSSSSNVDPMAQMQGVLGLGLGLDPIAAAQAAAVPLGLGMVGLPPGLAVDAASRVLVLMNMVTADELKDDEEYQDILEDVKEEAAQYGAVKSIVIPRPGSEHPQAVGKIFVEFAEVSQAVAAGAALRGRTFANRVVAAEFYDERKYANRELS